MPLSKTRWAATPDTPTFDGAGVPGLRASFWHGLWAPRGHAQGRHRHPSCRAPMRSKKGNTPRILAFLAITFMCMGALEMTTDRRTISAVGQEPRCDEERHAR
jgi:hypothetical protein